MDKGSLIDELFEAVKKAENCAKPNPPQNTDSLTAKNDGDPVLLITGADTQSPNNSRNRRVWARLTGISVCFLSSMRNW
jgi:hypothetical protein